MPEFTMKEMQALLIELLEREVEVSFDLALEEDQESVKRHAIAAAALALAKHEFN